MNDKLYNFDTIIRDMEIRLGSEKFAHSLGCAEEARELALLYGESGQDAYLAGLLHDCTKELDFSGQLKKCEEWGIIPDNDDMRAPQILHQITGARCAEVEFGVPPRVARAISVHTTGAADMTALDKIIYIADKTEKNRPPDISMPFRDISRQDLGLAVFEHLRAGLRYKIEKARFVHPATVRAYNSMCGEYCCEW